MLLFLLEVSSVFVPFFKGRPLVVGRLEVVLSTFKKLHCEGAGDFWAEGGLLLPGPGEIGIVRWLLVSMAGGGALASVRSAVLCDEI